MYLEQFQRGQRGQRAVAAHVRRAGRGLRPVLRRHDVQRKLQRHLRDVL